MNAWLERQPSRRYAVIMFVLFAMAWVLAMYVGYWLGYWLSGAARDHLSNAAGFSGPTIDLRFTVALAAVMSSVITWLRYRRARRKPRS
jgi:hypothetical protein